MIKAGTKGEHYSTIVVLLVACFFLAFTSSCGLDSYYVLDAPLSDGHTAEYSTTDYTSKYFSFLTYENGTNADYLTSSSEFKFLGTEVYYKIFNNYDTMVSYQSAVSSLNSTSYYSSAAEKMIDTQGYKPLRLSTGSITPLIKATGSNKYVYIRLTDYDTSDDFQQGICVGGSAMKSYDSTNALQYNGTAVFPRRYINSKYTFNFGDTSNTETGKVPAKGDEDVCWSDTTTTEGTWYVHMYAVSLGRDTTYTTSYSLVLHLGSVSIIQGSTNN